MLHERMAPILYVFAMGWSSPGGEGLPKLLQFLPLYSGVLLDLPRHLDPQEENSTPRDCPLVLCV